MYSFIFSARVSSVLPEFLFKIAIIFSVASFSLVEKLKFFCASVSVTDSDTVSVTVETLVGGSIEGLNNLPIGGSNKNIFLKDVFNIIKKLYLKRMETQNL